MKGFYLVLITFVTLLFNHKKPKAKSQIDKVNKAND